MDYIPLSIHKVSERLERNKGTLIKKISSATQSLDEKIRAFHDKFKSLYNKQLDDENWV